MIMHHYNLLRHGFALSRKQIDIPWINRDYSYLEYYRKAYSYEYDPIKKADWFHALLDAEGRRDYHLGSIRPINHAIQFDQTPNLELKEAKWEIYKVSVGFHPICELNSPGTEL